MWCDTNTLNVKWLSNKTEEILLIKNVSVEYVKKRVPISTQKYLCMDRMEEQVHYITIKIRKQKKNNDNNKRGRYHGIFQCEIIWSELWEQIPS